jgi:DNA-binding LytR/AlgR family response regulator
MDIEMPHLSGMECAARLRKLDQTTLLIFVTNMGNLAAMGYELEAFDFVVKPLNYELMKLKLNRAMDKLAKQQGDKLLIQSERAHISVRINDIYYVEVSRHQLTYHTAVGNYTAHGTMSQLREQLEPLGFSSCNNCYLINLKYVQRVQGFVVTVNGEELQISHPRKKLFMESLNQYISG